MTNIQHIGESKVEIPNVFKRTFGIVQKEDLVCMISILNYATKTFQTTWIKVDNSEICKESKFAGEFVIRKN